MSSGAGTKKKYTDTEAVGGKIYCSDDANDLGDDETYSKMIDRLILLLLLMMMIMIKMVTIVVVVDDDVDDENDDES